MVIHHFPSLLQTHWMFKLCCRKLHIQMEEDSEVSAKTEIARREVKRAACMIGGDSCTPLHYRAEGEKSLLGRFVRCPLCCGGILSASSPQLHPPVQHQQPCLHWVGVSWEHCEGGMACFSREDLQWRPIKKPTVNTSTPTIKRA